MIDISATRFAGVTVLELQGRMDSTSRRQLLSMVEDELAHNDRELVLNMSGVSYISTSGLKMLRRIMEVRGHVRIAEPSPRVRELLELTGLDQKYYLFPNQAEAIHAIMPVVNAHTHLELGWMERYRPNLSGIDFLDWITMIAPLRRELAEDLETIYEESIDGAIEVLIESGTTTVCDVSSTGLSIGPLMRSGLRGIVYVEVLGITPEQGRERLQKAIRLIEEWRPKERNGMRVGLSIHSPYSVIPDVWNEALDYAMKENLPLCIHVAESAGEYELFTKGTGPFADFMRSLQIDVKLPMMSPIRYLEELGALDQRPLLVHCVHVDDDDIRRIRLSESAVVHCPRSNLRLRCGRMPLEKFLEGGVPVFLGTDSLGSSPSLNVLDEMEFASALHYGRVEPAVIEAMAHQPFPLLV